jgi:PHP family Zn ribbon phosphoesterase
VPWCTECDRFLSPSTVRPDGTCPTCGRTVDPGAVASAAATKTASTEDDEKLPPIPWHLKLLALAVLVYLSFRLYQGIEWLIG